MPVWDPKANELFGRALDCANAAERQAMLDEVCANDGPLRERVETLLSAYENAGSFVEHPAWDTAPVGLGTTPPQGLNIAAGAPVAAGDVDQLLDFLTPASSSGTLGGLDQYEVLDVLGHGGMGIVLKARDPQLNREVAIKVLAPTLATNATARQRFVREAQAAAAVRHEHIVTIHGVGETCGLPYLVMEYVAGESLQHLIDRAGALEPAEIVRLGAQMAAGLAAAHHRGLVHRDIKPANILIDEETKRAKITDFGLARAVDDVRMTQEGVVAGTPQYMAPEQARGEAVDHRADLFSLGSVLYAMCTGRAPYQATSTVAMLRQVCEDRPRPIKELNADVPSWLISIVDRLHAKSPEERFQSAAEVAEALNNPPENTGIITTTSRRVRIWTVAGLLFLTGSLITLEAAGVTHVFSTIIRITAGEGTLIVEIDDPNIRVDIEGTDVRIRGAGVQEIRLRPGKYRVSATDSVGPLRERVVTITRGGQKTVHVSRERISLPTSNADWIPLFNGHDLSGWKTLPDHPGGWTVENGVLVGRTPPARYLFSERSDFGNFHLRVEARINPDGDSGVFFRSPFELRSFPRVPHAFPVGYEANILAVAGDDRYTGTLLSNTHVLAKPDASPTSSNDWFTLEVIAQDNQFVVKVNGRTTTEYVDRNHSYQKGHIVLQAYRAKAMPQFRKIEIRELPARETAIDGVPSAKDRPALALAQRGQWSEALQAFENRTTTDPNNYVTWVRLGTLQLYLGHIEAYRRASRELLARFSKTTDVMTAERIARVCALDPNWEGDFSLVEALMDQTPEAGWRVWDLLAKGRMEYRAGRAGSALPWLNRAAEWSHGAQGEPTLTATHAIFLATLALVKHELGDTKGAQLSLESARSLVATKMPDFATLHYPEGEAWTPWLWYDWLHCQILVREAEDKLGNTSEN